MIEAIAPTRRELGKAERRRRIVAAASALLREAGFDGVSMLQIAERAKVSPATVYNLFLTKGAVLQQVFDEDLQHYETLVDAAPANDAIDRIFRAVEVAAGLYRDDPGFYRAMIGGGRLERGLRSAISEPRVGFWRRMVEAARAEGRLHGETDPRLLGATLARIMRGALHEWAAGLISAERLAVETAYGFTLALMAYATIDAAPALRARLGSLEAALSSSTEG